MHVIGDRSLQAPEARHVSAKKLRAARDPALHAVSAS